MQSKRQLVSSGGEWETIVGYSRAVRTGNLVFVAGTTAMRPDGILVGPEDPGEQTRFILKRIESALQECGASLADVVRTRMFVTDIAHWEAIGRAHGEAFGSIRPAATMVEVSRLIADGLLVEMEADAVIPEKPA